MTVHFYDDLGYAENPIEPLEVQRPLHIRQGYRQPASQGPLFNLGNIGPPKAGGGLLQPRRRVVGQLPQVSGGQGVGDQAQDLSPLMQLFMRWQRQLQEAERFGEPSGRLSDQDRRGASRYREIERPSRRLSDQDQRIFGGREF